MSNAGDEEAARLEALWRGSFGDDYVDRNATVADHRRAFWTELLRDLPVERVLEVGCNLGANLRWLAELRAPGDVYGIDVNAKAIARLHETLPEVNALRGVARELPYRDSWFDLVFTMGVLIHQPPDGLAAVMAEVVRCSRRYVLCAEYFAETPTEVPYRNQSGALFKRDFGGLYRELYPSLVLEKQGFLSRDQGWDDVTWWLFRKADSPSS